MAAQDNSPGHSAARAGDDLDRRRLRAGIVGGGEGAFIGAVHRLAAELDGQARVIAGALSSDPERARRSAERWFLERSYDSWQRMADDEAARPDGIDFVIIATPNHLHAPVARAFLAAGIHVVCDKPMTLSAAEAEALVADIERPRARPLVFALTHNYTGYPAVRHARARVAEGALGEVRKVLVEYNQDWLMTPLEHSGQKQATWRADPARAGVAGALGDIGTHAENLLEYVTGRRITALCADFSRFVPGRALEDDANLLIRLDNGGKGTLVCSQVACGEENDLSLRVYGSQAGLEWRQQEPNTLLWKPAGKPWERVRVGTPALAQEAQSLTRVPAGHPEGYLEAFATIYRLAIADMRRAAAGQRLQGGYPSARDGLRGMRFLEAAVASANAGATWVTLPAP